METGQIGHQHLMETGFSVPGHGGAVVKEQPGINPAVSAPIPDDSKRGDYDYKVTLSEAAKGEKDSQEALKPENGNISEGSDAEKAESSSGDSKGTKDVKGSKESEGSEEKGEKKTEEANEQEVQAEIQKLKQREQEVIAHEQAHKAVGGQYAGAIQYEYTRGPDSQRYISGGEVSIDTSKEDTPEATIKKMQQIKRAALAPQEPSPQDHQVASDASRKEMQARAELAKERSSGEGDISDKTNPNEQEEEGPGRKNSDSEGVSDGVGSHSKLDIYMKTQNGVINGAGNQATAGSTLSMYV